MVSPRSRLLRRALPLLPASLLLVASCSSRSGGGIASQPDAGKTGEGSTTGGGSGGSGRGSSGSSSGGTASNSSGSSSGSSSGASGSSTVSSESSGSSSASGSADAGPEPACTSSTAACTTDNTGCNVGSYYLYDNQWNCSPAPNGITCGPESAYGCTNPDGTVAFVVTSNQPAGNTAVLTYPAMQDNLSGNPTLGSFSSITATFEETSPHVGDYEVAWDCWFNNQANELMIWVDNFNQTPGGNKVASAVSLGGRTWDVYMSGSQSKGYIAYVANTNLTSGTVDLLAIFSDAASHGYMPAASASTVGQLSFGIEVCSTDGQVATWTVNHYGITTN